MRRFGISLPSATRRLKWALLSSLLLPLGACRIRRELPKRQPVPQASASAVSASSAQVGTIEPASAPPAQANPGPDPEDPSESVPAPKGVLVVALSSAAFGPASTQAALASVRIATQQIVAGGSTDRAVALGLTAFERAEVVPVSQGAPLRRGGARPQCDAVVVAADARLSGVGAVSDLTSPARLALETHQRGWGLLVGTGVTNLAAEIGVTEVRWNSGVTESVQVKAPLEGVAGATSIPKTVVPSDSGHGGVQTEELNHDAGVVEPASNVDLDAPTPEPSALEIENHPTADSAEVSLPSLAMVAIRDANGRYAIAAEGCGSEGDPSGQLTTLFAHGATAYVAADAAIFVAGGREALLHARHAERIYRRLQILQVPEAAANWGLRTSAGASVVVVISRLGSAIASIQPVVWARNHADGESTAPAAPSDQEPRQAARLADWVRSGQEPDLLTRPSTSPRTGEPPPRDLAVEQTQIGKAIPGRASPHADASDAGRTQPLQPRSQPVARPAPSNSISTGNVSPRHRDRDAGSP